MGKITTFVDHAVYNAYSTCLFLAQNKSKEVALSKDEINLDKPCSSKRSSSAVDDDDESLNIISKKIKVVIG